MDLATYVHYGHAKFANGDEYILNWYLTIGLARLTINLKFISYTIGIKVINFFKQRKQWSKIGFSLMITCEGMHQTLSCRSEEYHALETLVAN